MLTKIFKISKLKHGRNYRTVDKISKGEKRQGDDKSKLFLYLKVHFSDTMELINVYILYILLTQTDSILSFIINLLLREKEN